MERTHEVVEGVVVGPVELVGLYGARDTTNLLLRTLLLRGTRAFLAEEGRVQE